MTDADVPIKYMDRTRHYYRALGYTRDYIWATFDDVPFSQLAKPLSECSSWSFGGFEAAAELASEGLFGGLTARLQGVPTEYSQRKTLTEDAPEILSRVREDGADAAVLCPLCPVCHQTVSLVARHLETNGIPTVIVGSALDVVEHCGGKADTCRTCGSRSIRPPRYARGHVLAFARPENVTVRRAMRGS
jgi:hypothetical protein